MISILILLFTTLITGLVTLLPDSSGLPSGVTDAVGRIGGLFSSFDWLLPISLIYTIIVWLLVFELGILAYRFTMWIIHMVRGN